LELFRLNFLYISHLHSAWYMPLPFFSLKILGSFKWNAKKVGWQRPWKKLKWETKM
jgi:hypothetical protein